MQTDAWEREYKNPNFLTKYDKPQKDTLRFVKYLKKHNFDFKNAKVLDLGCGTGRNSNFFASKGCQVYGFEISKTALDLAKERAKEEGLDVKYFLKSMIELSDFADETFDIVLDVTSSNSLDENERGVYIKEVNRVLKKEGFFFFKGLCLEADQNAKNLLKNSPGKEQGTYFLKEIGLTERVWSREDLLSYYGKFFEFIFLERKSSYLEMSSRHYKRNFWIGYLVKK
jgi:ubiquinone/menaquinone biosynthesis C-methylase UbiE